MQAQAPNPPLPADEIISPRVKPLLRGVSHQLSFFLAWPLLYWLVSNAPTPRAAVYAGIYAVSLLLLLGTSALYHRKTWGPVGRARMKRLDHSVIFVLIAGTYTPIFMLAVGGMRASVLCVTLWLGALGGIGQTLFWPTAPRWLHVGIYVVLGWTGALGLSGEWSSIGPAAVGMHVLGGVLYTLGAVAYARKRPDPFPTVFGYHEIFHLLVVLACGCLFEVVRRSVAFAG